jgi:hypothetical protein
VVKENASLKTKSLLTCAAALGAAGTVYALWLRPWHLCWGATQEEIEETLPGDELTPDAVHQTTHALTIDAPVSEVWQWLVQLGQDKAGFYSYTWLENLAGCRMPNVTHVMPEHQEIKVGDELWLHPHAPPLPVLLVIREQALVFGSNMETLGTWGFVLKPLGSKTTRLIVRGRSHQYKSLLGRFGYHGVFEPAHFIMERKMMLTIKHLAERHWQSSTQPLLKQGQCRG